MQYSNEEVAVISGLIANYLCGRGASSELNDTYREVLQHLNSDTLNVHDYQMIEKALDLLSSVWRTDAEGSRSITSALLHTKTILNQ